MSGVLHHLDDLDATLRDVRRVLCSNGYLVIRNATKGLSCKDAQPR